MKPSRRRAVWTVSTKAVGQARGPNTKERCIAVSPVTPDPNFSTEMWWYRGFRVFRWWFNSRPETGLRCDTLKTGKGEHSGVWL